MGDTKPKGDLESALTEELETSSVDTDKAAETTSEAKHINKVRVGDQDFDPDELTDLVAKGKMAQEIETKQNVDLKELYPEYTRKSQLLKDPEKLRDYLSSQFGDTSKQHAEDDPKDDGKDTALSAEVQKEISQARKLGFIHKDDVDDIVRRAVSAASTTTKAELKLEGRLTELEKLYNGSDTSPVKIKFDKSKVLDYMVENFSEAKRVPDPEDIFKLLNLEEFKKAASGTKEPAPTPPTTEKAGSTGTRTPKGREVPSFKDEETMRKYLEEEFTAPQVEV
jgi:hypothetical protein